MDNRKPSQVTDDYWIHATNLKTRPRFEDTGKWMVYLPFKDLDEAWEKIKKATKDGILGCSSKTATALENPNAIDPSIKIICVYTYCDDIDKTAKVAWTLYKMGVVFSNSISYKTDDATHAGRYVKDGYKRVSKYTVKKTHFESVNSEEEFIELFKQLFC